jgi:hypothetical protein
MPQNCVAWIKETVESITKEMGNIWGGRHEGKSTCVGDIAAHCNTFPRYIFNIQNDTNR